MRKLLLALMAILLTACTSKEEEVQALVASQLRDPGAAQFTHVGVVGEGDDLVACGEVNGKNAFGAYVGAMPFMLRGDRLWLSDEGSAGDVAACCGLFLVHDDAPDDLIADCEAKLPEPVRVR